MSRLLLVDDSLDGDEKLLSLLAQVGHQVVTRCSASEEFHAHVHEVNAIVIDVQSPDDAILARITELHRTPCPIPMFSRDDDSEKIRASVEAGVNAYVVGWIQPERLTPILAAASARFEQLRSLRRSLEETQNKLAERKLIERAKGLLMKRGITEEEASVRSH
jgi:response regulator NasT